MDDKELFVPSEFFGQKPEPTYGALNGVIAIVGFFMLAVFVPVVWKVWTWAF